MGSWANSLHVRHSNPEAVISVIKDLISSQGYTLSVAQPTAAGAGSPHALGDFDRPARPRRNTPSESWDDEGDEAAFEQSLAEEDADPGMGPDGSRERTVIVYQPFKGWVSILDSLGLESDLEEVLSRKFQTQALSLYVNDSDTWGYELHNAGQSRDQYDSSGDLSGEDSEEMSPELLAAIEREDDVEVDRLMEKELQRYAPRGPIVFHDGRMAMPTDMAFLKQKIREGRATLIERVRYAWKWVQFQCRKLWTWLVPGSARFGFDSPHAREVGPEQIDAHIRAIREVFPNAPIQDLRHLLPQNRFPSEELQREFLRIVGLPTLWAYLSFDYRADFTHGELQRAGIVEAAELHFVRPDASGRGKEQPDLPDIWGS